MYLPVELINAILMYLAKQPYEQVAHIIAAIKQEEAKDNQDGDIPKPPK